MSIFGKLLMENLKNYSYFETLFKFYEGGGGRFRYFVIQNYERSWTELHFAIFFSFQSKVLNADDSDALMFTKDDLSFYINNLIEKRRKCSCKKQTCLGNYCVMLEVKLLYEIV